MVNLISKSTHIKALVLEVMLGCRCARCVEHLVAEVLLSAAAAEISVPPTYPSEIGTAAHMRDQLRELAREVSTNG